MFILVANDGDTIDGLTEVDVDTARCIQWHLSHGNPLSVIAGENTEVDTWYRCSNDCKSDAIMVRRTVQKGERAPSWRDTLPHGWSVDCYGMPLCPSCSVDQSPQGAK
jgi:hypothetical protein